MSERYDAKMLRAVVDVVIDTLNETLFSRVGESYALAKPVCDALGKLITEAGAREPDLSLVAWVKAASESALGEPIRWETDADLLIVLDRVYVSLLWDSGSYAIIRNAHGDELSEHHTPAALTAALNAIADVKP